MSLYHIKKAYYFSLSTLFMVALLMSTKVHAEPMQDSNNYVFAIDSGTFSKLPSPRSLVNYYQNWETLGVISHDLLEKHVYKTVGRGNGKWIKIRRGIQAVFMPLVIKEEIINPTAYFNTTGWEVTHEYAHRSRGALVGIDYGFNPDYQPLGDNPYSLGLHLLTTNNETGAEIWRNPRGEYLHPRPSFLPIRDPEVMETRAGVSFQPSDEISFIGVAAGINQQVNLARAQAKRSSFNDSMDIANFYSYYINAASYFAYDDDLLSFIFGDSSDASASTANRPLNEGDRAQMISRWKALGRSYDDAELAQNQLLSTALSGTTIAYALGLIDYVNTGNRYFKPIRFYGFRLPDFYNYYTTNGPTLMVTTDYRLGTDKIISFAYETVTDGKSADELTLGYDQKFVMQGDYFRSLHLATDIIFNFENDKTAGGVEAGLATRHNMHIALGYRYYHFDMLSGERNIPSLEDGKDDQEIYTSIRFAF